MLITISRLWLKGYILKFLLLSISPMKLCNFQGQKLLERNLQVLWFETIVGSSISEPRFLD